MQSVLNRVKTRLEGLMIERAMSNNESMSFQKKRMPKRDLYLIKNLDQILSAVRVFVDLQSYQVYYQGDGFIPASVKHSGKYSMVMGTRACLSAVCAFSLDLAQGLIKSALTFNACARPTFSLFASELEAYQVVYNLEA